MQNLHRKGNYFKIFADLFLGFNVVAIISDLGGGLHGELAVSPNQRFFKNPCNEENLSTFLQMSHIYKS